MFESVQKRIRKIDSFAINLSKRKFYILSFTWGLIVTLSGCIMALIFRIAGYKPKKFGYCYYFESRHLKGGFNAGIFIFVHGGATKRILCHEHGHSLQNCIYGPLMMFAVCIPSTVRYHFRNLRKRINPHCILTKYDKIWFEAEATRYGKRFENVEFISTYEKHLLDKQAQQDNTVK